MRPSWLQIKPLSIHPCWLWVKGPNSGLTIWCLSQMDFNVSYFQVSGLSSPQPYTFNNCLKIISRISSRYLDWLPPYPYHSFNRPFVSSQNTSDFVSAISDRDVMNSTIFWKFPSLTHSQHFKLLCWIITSPSKAPSDMIYWHWSKFSID